VHARTHEIVFFSLSAFSAAWIVLSLVASVLGASLL
jgi:hypothetical protein